MRLEVDRLSQQLLSDSIKYFFRLPVFGVGILARNDQIIFLSLLVEYDAYSVKI